MNQMTFLLLILVVACSGKSGGGSSTPEVVVEEAPPVEIQFPANPSEPEQREPNRPKQPFKLKKTYNGEILAMIYPHEQNKAIVLFGGEDALRLYKSMDIRVVKEGDVSLKQGHDVGCQLASDNKAQCELAFDYRNGLIINDKSPTGSVWKPFKNTDSWIGEILTINDRRETAVLHLKDHVKNKDAESLYETLDIVGSPKAGEPSTHEKKGTHISCEKKDADLTLDKYEYLCTMTIKYEKGYVSTIQ